MFDSNHFTLSSMFSFQNAGPLNRKAVYTGTLVLFSICTFIYLWELDRITTQTTSQILVNFQAVAGGKFYRLPPDKENTATQPYSSLVFMEAFPMETSLVNGATEMPQNTRHYLRNTMKQDQLNSCMPVHCHKTLVDTIDWVTVAKIFASRNEQRKGPFGCSFCCWHHQRLHLTGLEIKKIVRSPFGDQLEKYSRHMQIFSCQFV